MLITIFCINQIILSFIYIIAMVKNTRRRKTEPKDEITMKKLSQREYGKLVREMMGSRQAKSKVKRLLYDRIKELLDESNLQCPICLQILLKPVLAQCGHIFCLSCAEDLAKNDYSCGICHDHEPTYDLTIYKHFEVLIKIFLAKCTLEEREAYQQRSKTFEENQQKRKIMMLEAGRQVDFWCTEQKCWKSGIVESLSQSGTAVVTDSKSSKSIQINILSRRLAKHRFFTKEESLLPTMTLPQNMFSSFSFNGINRAISPFSYGMPMFLNMFGSSNQGQSFGGMETTEYYGYLPQFRPFTF